MDNSIPPADSSTIEEYRKTLSSLYQLEDRVKKYTERYPVFVIMAGKGYRFESPSDVTAFLIGLESRVADRALTGLHERTLPSHIS